MSYEHVVCFMVEDTGVDRRFLRRYAVDSSNPTHLHNARVSVDEVPGGGAITSGDPDYPRNDPRWPRFCKCGYVFQEWDHWQVFLESIYRNPLDGSEYLLSELPIGAMWHADWFANRPQFRGPDGLCLVVKLPNNTEWVIDGSASDGGRWTREGTPPKITVNPSILAHAVGGYPEYHGWLRAGILIPA